MNRASICLNPQCLKYNDINHRFCQYCGTKIILQERYQGIKTIGQGGFGRTFLAIDKGKPSQPLCVIKQFFPSAQGTETLSKAAELFALEAERLEQLGKHDQIPDLLAYFTHDDNRQYLVQEYIKGENLEQELKTHLKFNESQVREILVDLLTVLKFIHAKQVIHRDIKPANIIRRESDNKLVLVDFGAAKHATNTALGVTGTAIGSVGYCAPEQTYGKADFNSDLYSLGVTCLHLITGVEPFQLFDSGENEWVWRDFLAEQMVSEELGQILDKLVKLATKKRYQSAAEVLEVLTLKSSITVAAKISEIPLKSTTTGVYYSKLHDLLQEQNWKEADQETLKVMLQATRREKFGFFVKDSIDNFPCEDLQIMDQLWLKYSNGRFGFSVQAKIWLECGGKIDHDTECKLADRLKRRENDKWISYNQLNFDLSAPVGHLPAWGRSSIIGAVMFRVRVDAWQMYCSIAQRTIQCQI